MAAIRKSKLADLKDAVALVKEGDYLALGGFAAHNRPNAFVRELVKRGTGKLTLSTSPQANYETDIIIGAGLARKVFGSNVALDYLGIAPNFRKAAEAGEIEVVEGDEGVLIAGYLAAVANLPCHPVGALTGSDVLRASSILKRYRADDGEEIVAVIPLRPDVAVIHVQEADEYGNGRHVGSVQADSIIAKASRIVILTADEIISHRTIEDDPHGTTIPGFLVQAVVHTPYGSHPCSSPGHYSHDEEHLREYRDYAERSRRDPSSGAFREYLRKYVHEPDTIYEYLDRVGGLRKMLALERAARSL